MDVAIVGAGAAGAGAAFALRESAHRVVVFERAEAVGGRATARRTRGCTYDPGANYLKAEDPRVARLVTETLDATGLVDVERPVWTFESDGTIAPGEGRDEHKWTYESGLSTLVERLLAGSAATVHTGTAVTGLAREADQWRLAGDGEPLGRFDRLVLTPPAPETGALLDASDWETDRRDRLVGALQTVPYRPVVSAILHYPFTLDRPFYALVNVDREHAVSWLAREDEKRGHVPAGESLLVVQLAPGPSARRLGDPAEAVCADAASLVADLLGDDRLAEPDWTDRAGWRHALVDEPADASVLRLAGAAGLSFAGDWERGEARVHAALRSGLEAGDRLR